jgi:hypothetical protein
MLTRDTKKEMSSLPWNKIMPSQHDPQRDADQLIVYQIRIKGHLSRRWKDWFEGLTVTLEENGNTLLTGPVIDQAALHGILKRVRDLGMPLLSVNSIEPGPQAHRPVAQ